jgi:hypothetical protein
MHMQGQLMTMEIKGQKPRLLLSLTLIVTTLTGCLRTVFSSDVVIPILNDSRYTISRWECPKFLHPRHLPGMWFRLFMAEPGNLGMANNPLKTPLVEGAMVTRLIHRDVVQR